MVLDDEILREVDSLIQHYKSFKDMNVKKEGLDEQYCWDIERIEKLCAAEDYAPKPYINYYEEAIKELWQD